MLDQIKSIVTVRNTIPVLSCIRIQNGRACATNLDMWADIPFPVDIEACVPYHDLLALTQQANGCEHEYKIKDGRLTFRAGAISGRMPVLPVDDFPPAPSVEDGQEAVFSKADLAAAATCMYSGEGRYYLHGVSLRNDRLCATNGGELLRRPATFAGECILHDTFVRFLIRHGEDEIRLLVDHTKVVWRGPDITVTSKLIDGTFPDETRIIPTDLPKKWIWRHADLEKAVAIASLTDEYAAFEKKGGVMTALAKRDGRESDWYGEVEGDDARIGFKIASLRRVLDVHSVSPAASGKTDLTMEFSDPQSPTLWNGDLVVMPASV
jgi:DNA polymerase-3 subunit beta